MLTFQKLGSWGNLGNQLFEIASMYGIAHDNNQQVTFPYWKYSHYFDHKFPVIQRISNPIVITEKGYHYTPEHWRQEIAKHPERLISITGWLQTEKYWKSIPNKPKSIFKFKPDYEKKLKDKYQQAFSRQTIAISIRRGDFVGNSNYELLPINYYLGALFKYFPNYKDYNIFCFSDDIPYCRHHFECLDNVYYPHAASDIDQLCLLTQCDHFIISQSTFSWWGAYLGQKDHSIVVRSPYNMAGELLKNNNERDYYPDKWVNVYDHKKEKIDLSDVTFTIPVHYDHEDRAQNLRLNLSYLTKHFNTNIIIGEQKGHHFKSLGYKYMNFDYPQFHRTKMLNEMANEADTEIIANWDADVIVPPLQIYEAVKAIREGKDMVYPYDGRFGRVERKRWYQEIRDHLDTGIWRKEKFTGTRDTDSRSVGGALFLNKEKFMEAGMENENFVSYAPEDQERWYRFRKLGYQVSRITGNLYHLDHFIGPNSYTQHSFYRSNEKEFHRIVNIPDLKAEVERWPWYRKYTTKYYSEIISGSTKSRDIVYQIPEIYTPGQSIIDIGAGLGFWGMGISNYFAVDYKIPEKLLKIPVENYREWDITSDKPFPFPGKYDLALCMEVMEHVPEEHAERVIKLLTSLSDKILFSAAIPGQGGVGHVNEKFQTYWEALFRKFNYYPLLQLPDHQDIEIWYRNNACLYVNYPTSLKLQDYIHPELYTNIVGTLTNWQNILPYFKP